MRRVERETDLRCAVGPDGAGRSAPRLQALPGMALRRIGRLGPRPPGEPNPPPAGSQPPVPHSPRLPERNARIDEIVHTATREDLVPLQTVPRDKPLARRRPGPRTRGPVEHAGTTSGRHAAGTADFAALGELGDSMMESPTVSRVKAQRGFRLARGPRCERDGAPFDSPRWREGRGTSLRASLKPHSPDPASPVCTNRVLC